MTIALVIDGLKSDDNCMVNMWKDNNNNNRKKRVNYELTNKFITTIVIKMTNTKNIINDISLYLSIFLLL